MIELLRYVVIAVLFVFSINHTSAIGDENTKWQDCPNTDTNDPLHTAVRANDVLSVKCLLENGFNPNVLDRHGYAALTTSIGVNVKITNLLLEHKADVNISNAAALGRAVRDFGEYINRRNSGNHDFDSFDLYPPNASLEDKISWSKVILYKLLDYGADYNLLSNSDRYDKEHSTLISLIFSLCETENENYFKYMDFADYFYEISSRSKHDIKFTNYDLTGIGHLETLSNLGLYNKECLDASRTYFLKSAA